MPLTALVDLGRRSKAVSDQPGGALVVGLHICMSKKPLLRPRARSRLAENATRRYFCSPEAHADGPSDGGLMYEAAA